MMSSRFKHQAKCAALTFTLAAIALMAMWQGNQWRLRQERRQVLRTLLTEVCHQANKEHIQIAPINGIGPPRADTKAILELPACVELQRIIGPNPRDWVELLTEEQNETEAPALYAISALLERNDPCYGKVHRRSFFQRLFNPSPADSWWPW